MKTYICEDHPNRPATRQFGGIVYLCDECAKEIASMGYATGALNVDANLTSNNGLSPDEDISK